ncbi:MAG: hypothetical protein K9I31_02610 [Chitinophagaceae bacterium]|nr:hypothetical protein [Chitinophagaceae bacterium]
MKKSFYFLSLLCTQCICIATIGQSNQVTFEQVQMYSSIQPEGKYWHPTTTQVQAFASILDTALFNPLQLQRDTSFATKIKILNKSNQIGKLVIDWSQSQSSPFHAYLEIYELQPEQTFSNSMVNIIIPKKDSIQSTWFLTCTILDATKKPVFQKTILIGMIPIANQGIGYPMNLPVSPPKSLFKAIQSGVSYFDKDGEELAYIEAKVPNSFASDNFTMPLIQTKPRITVDTSKDFFQFTQNSSRVVLRIPTAMMQKIDTKDKTTNNPFFAILPEIKKRTNTLFKEYYQAIQPLRNTSENKDYSLEAYIEFNPLIDPELRNTPPIRFLPDSIHKIYADTNLIGRFKVIELPANTGLMFNSNKIYNGYDSSSMYTLNTNYPKGIISISKSVEGNIGKDTFKILFNNEIDVKMIYLNNLPILVAKGKNKPNYLVPIEQVNQHSISPLLLLIAYSEIFQSPN